MRALFGLAYRFAHGLRHRWRKWRKVPLEGVSMIARDLDGRILMIRLNYAEAGWCFPGGGAKRGETMLEAAVRELAEETGCRAIAPKPVGQLAETVSGSPHMAHVFTCTTRDAPVPDGREVVEARFFPSHSLPYPMTALTEARLELWRAFQRGVTTG